MSYNTNPNGYDGPTLAGFQDPSPWLEGCDRMNCTAVVGGDHAPTCEVTLAETKVQCWLCKRWFGRNDATWVPTVFSDGEIGTTCDTCYERGQEAVIVGLDMMGDDDD
jgi:hypothetical protein